VACSAAQCYSPRIRRAESVTFVFPLTERMPPVVATRSRSIQHLQDVFTP
jgi:hypothetical protein